MTNAADPAAIEALSFEAALQELERIVQTLESGQAPLEESISVYERGALLKAHCEKKLEAARLRVEKVVLAQGTPTGVEPAEFG
ncbi:exodeoxyribonuclease VII small subunit [Caulobacter sp. NIBR1757]|uniref:exodeoxyribonuclease VII small subunit n=1 Tax=Caulobacter sp. NIBR1757 TaxID=3016000 RepID=UPI0022F08A15|nr:exodeoxyribonuclease VII small subunit [Caulobacter sp. NIBR1757]WGM38631.1 Exodeoxyribonuclease 7 small subunit [Caulobacter sp. NIBR1757]